MRKSARAALKEFSDLNKLTPLTGDQQCAEHPVIIFGAADDDDSNDKASGDSSGALNQS